MPFVSDQRRTERGFTLVEILVVIAVIAVLVGVFMPTLAKARQAALNLQCQTNLRTIGQAMRGFAHDHDDRFPNNGHGAASYNWDSILNREYFKNNAPSGGTRVTLGVPDSRGLGCPGFQVSRKGGEALAMNQNAAGGYSATLPAGPYGIDIPNPTSVNALYTDFFRLGARTSKFRSPSRKFLVIEQEDTGNYYQAKYPYDDKYATWHLGDNAAFPIYAGHDGAFSFRHGTPANRQANFLFIDGHVESLTPKDEMNTKRRWNMDAW